MALIRGPGRHGAGRGLPPLYRRPARRPGGVGGPFFIIPQAPGARSARIARPCARIRATLRASRAARSRRPGLRPGPERRMPRRIHALCGTMMSVCVSAMIRPTQITEAAMQIVVAGANGVTGRIVLRMLTEAGHQPVAMIRNFAQREALEALGAECRIGDLEKPVGYAVRGCRGAIFAAGSGSKTGPEKTTDVDQNGAMAFIETCVRMNARRFVMLSSIAVDAPERGPESLHHYFRRQGDCRPAPAGERPQLHHRAAGLPHQRAGHRRHRHGRRPRPPRQGDPLGDPRGCGAGAGGLPRPRQHHRARLSR